MTPRSSLIGQGRRIIIAVGTVLAVRPPHRSGHAELPHPAPALGNDAEPHQWVRMADVGSGKPTPPQAAHLLRRYGGSLTSALG